MYNTAYETVEVDVVLNLVITCTTQHYTVEADVWLELVQHITILLKWTSGYNLYNTA